MKVENILQWLGAVAALCAAVWLRLDTVYQALLVFVVLDVASGSIRAAVRGQLSSNTAYIGILKKGGELILIGMAYFVQRMVPDGLGSVPLPQALAGFYCYVEAVSILENASAVGVPIPQFLKDALAVLSPDKTQTTPQNNNSGVVG